MREAGPDARDEAFRKGLRELGWIEGENLIIDYRWAAFDTDRLPALAEELVGLEVEVMVTATQRVTRAAKNATRTVPIVMMWAADAVENGLVDSLARPGGNITGLSENYPETNAKLLEVLHDTLPQVARVAFLWDPDSRVYARTFKFVQPIAPSLGLTLQSLALRRGERAAKELESMLAAAARERAGALVVMGRLYGRHGPAIEAFSAKNRIPVFSISTSSLEKYSGLLAYAPDWTDLARRAATYVDKILKGANPADLPVQRPAKFNLIVNLRTAKNLGIEIPPSILYRADKLIK
jgi:putative ABC transport system substrate-binding protein